MLYQQLSNFVLAVKEHHHWVPSPRARVLEEWTVRTSAILHYAAYLLFAWLAYKLWTEVPKVVLHTTPIGLLTTNSSLDLRSSLFYVFAGAFLVPAGLFIVWFMVKWSYKLFEAFAHHRLPRFARLPLYPLVLCFVAFTGLGYHMTIATTLARGYLEAREVVMIAKKTGSGQPEHSHTDLPQRPAGNNDQSEKLIEELRKRYEEKNEQPPPEPLELEALRDKRTKVD